MFRIHGIHQRLDHTSFGSAICGVLFKDGNGNHQEIQVASSDFTWISNAAPKNTWWTNRICRVVVWLQLISFHKVPWRSYGADSCCISFSVSQVMRAPALVLSCLVFSIFSALWNVMPPWGWAVGSFMILSFFQDRFVTFVIIHRYVTDSFQTRSSGKGASLSQKTHETKYLVTV